MADIKHELYSFEALITTLSAALLFIRKWNISVFKNALHYLKTIRLPDDQVDGKTTTISLTPDSNMIDIPQSKGPLIAFSGAGMLWAYYTGIVACLRDHFDITASNISLSGISCGTSAVTTIFFDLSIEQAFDMGLMWQKLFDSRQLKFMFLSTSKILNLIMNKLQSFGIDDGIFADKYKKYGQIYFGVTALRKSGRAHRCLNNFSSVKQMMYAGLCSMRTVPFFKTVGYYDGDYVVDGNFSKCFSIPQHYNDRNTPDGKDKVIRISSEPGGTVDIKPMCKFKWKEWCTSGGLNDNLQRFNKGYKDAAQLKSILSCVGKGLIWNNNFDYNKINVGENKNKWNAHLNKKIEKWNNKIKKNIENQHC